MTEKMADWPLQEGCSYSSWEDAEKVAFLYAEQHYFVWVTESSTTVKSVNEKLLKLGEELFKPELVYAAIRLVCSFAGKKRVASSTGRRPNQSTWKQNCPVRLHFAATSTSLYVKKAVLTGHNHELSPEAYSVIPKVKRMKAANGGDVPKVKWSYERSKRIKPLKTPTVLLDMTGKTENEDPSIEIADENIQTETEDNQTETITFELTAPTEDSDPNEATEQLVYEEEVEYNNESVSSVQEETEERSLANQRLAEEHEAKMKLLSMQLEQMNKDEERKTQEHQLRMEIMQAELALLRAKITKEAANDKSLETHYNLEAESKMVLS